MRNPELNDEPWLDKTLMGNLAYIIDENFVLDVEVCHGL